MRRSIVIGCLLAMMLMPIFAAGVTDSYEGTIGSYADMEIKSDIPSIRIVTNTSENRVTARLSGPSSDRFVFTSRETREGFSVEVKRKRTIEVDLFSILPTELIISVPRQIVFGEVEISAVSGSITIEEDVRAQSIEIGTVSGALSIPSLFAEREVTVESVSGLIRAHSIEASRITMGSVSGKIEVTELVAQAGTVTVETVSGSTTIEGLYTPNSEIQTVSGSTTIYFPPTFTGLVETSTISGSVSVDFPNMQNVTSDKQRTYYQIGSGNGYSRISNVSGALKISQHTR